MCWLLALGYLFFALDSPLMEKYDDLSGNPPGTQRMACLAIACCCALLPLPLAGDVAMISDSCEALLAALRTAASRALGQGNLRAHNRMLAVTTTLRELNRGEGLGIQLGGEQGVLLDKRMLTYTMAKVVGGGSTPSFCTPAQDAPKLNKISFE